MPRIPTIRDSDDCSISLWSEFCREVGRERTEGGERIMEGWRRGDGSGRNKNNNKIH